MTKSLDFAPRLLAAPQAAHYLGVSESKLHTLNLPRKILDGKRLYDRIELDAYDGEEGVIAVPPEISFTEGCETCVYRFFDSADCLLYVGISYCFLTRAQQHATDKLWFSRVVYATVDYYPNRDFAEFAEAKAIRNEAPRFNSAPSHRPDPEDVLALGVPAYIKAMGGTFAPQRSETQRLLNHAWVLCE